MVPTLRCEKYWDIVYDSIIQNKEKTKTYWEQLMMAADRFKPKREYVNIVNDGEEMKSPSDTSEQDYYDAQSHVSIHSTSEMETLDSENYSPKIVEAVTKKLREMELKPLQREESVIERDIRLQLEKEEQVARERKEAREKAMQKTNSVIVEPKAKSNSITTTVSLKAAHKIADELREMREREEELRKLRHQLSITKDDLASPVDDGFSSIPTTDEGTLSEYGSEEKENSFDRVVSPDLLGGSDFSHKRNLSVDSTSSGHSSGSGGNVDSATSRRKIKVKPLSEIDNDVTQSFIKNKRSAKETPIEREIRLACEREEELKMQKLKSTLRKESKMPEIVKIGKLNPPIHENNKSDVGTSYSSANLKKTQIKVINLMTPQKFSRTVPPKGIMEKFLASRGKITMNAISLNNTQESTATLTNACVPAEVLQNSSSSLRRGYTSAEAKIQSELSDMRKREEELRLQRHQLAQSQPNLLFALEEDENPSNGENGTMLRSSSSNPNLLEEENEIAEKYSNTKQRRRRSNLIMQWEKKILKNKET